MARSEVEVSSDDRGTFYVLFVKGPIDAMNAGTVRKAADCAIGMGKNMIVMELSKATGIDSTGIALLTTLSKTVGERNGRLCLVGMQRDVAASLDRAGLSRVLEVHPSLAHFEAAISREIDKEERGFYVILKIPAQFSLPVVQPLRTAIEESMDADYKDFVFDMSKTHLITSVGIGVLANLQKKLGEKGGGVHLVGLTESVRRLLDATNLLKVVASYDRLEQVEERLI